jgi:hypothetical protein
MPTGFLGIDFNTNISSLDGRRLARQGPGNLLANATRFLQNDRGLGDGDFIFVTPGAGTTPALLFIQEAGLAAGNAPPMSMVATATKKRAKKAAKKPAKKSAKKTTKRAAKKAASKPAKKSSRKKSGKSAAKKK